MEFFKRLLYILFRIKFYQPIGYIYQRHPYRVTLFFICPYSLKMKFETQDCNFQEMKEVDKRIDQYSPNESFIIVYVDRDYDTDYTYGQITKFLNI